MRIKSTIIVRIRVDRLLNLLQNCRGNYLKLYTTKKKHIFILALVFTV